MGGRSKQQQRQTRANSANKTNDNSPAKQSNKRDHSSLSSPEVDNPPKKPTATMPNDSETLTIDSIRNLLAEQTNAINKKFESELTRLKDEIKADFQERITELHNKIDSNQASMQLQIDNIKVDVKRCMEQAGGTDDDLQRMAKLNELKISGIAYNNQENLNDIFSNIAKLVQFDLSIVNNVPSITRITKWNTATKTSVPTSIVIVKFVANHIRNDFYSLYMNKIAAKQLIMSENIGLQKGTRIIIGENLTPNNSSIFVEANKLKKLNKLCTVFTQNGLVHVKTTRNSKSTPIRSQAELETFVNANPSQSTSNNASKVNSTPATVVNPMETVATKLPTSLAEANAYLEQQRQKQFTHK